MLGAVTPDLDDLLTSPRALFAYLNGLDYHRSRVLLDTLATRGQGAHPAVVAVALGKDHVLAGQATRLLAKQIREPTLARQARTPPNHLMLLARHGVHDPHWASHPSSVARRQETLASVEGALSRPRSLEDGWALLPWLVALTRSGSDVAEPARRAAEEVLGAPLGDDAAIVERLLGR